MKYLLLIVRHLFPKKYWTLYRTINIVNSKNEPTAVKLLLKDQFGNIKVKTIRS